MILTTEERDLVQTGLELLLGGSEREDATRPRLAPFSLESAALSRTRPRRSRRLSTKRYHSSG